MRAWKEARNTVLSTGSAALMLWGVVSIIGAISPEELPVQTLGPFLPDGAEARTVFGILALLVGSFAHTLFAPGSGPQLA